MLQHLRRTAKEVVQKSRIIGQLVTRAELQLHARRHRVDLSGASPETRAILEEIERAGVVVKPGYLDRATCAQAVADIDRLLDDRSQLVHRSGSDRRIYGAEHLSPLVAQFAHDVDLLNLARRYQGSDTCCAFTLVQRTDRLEDDAGIANSGWHRDSFYRQFKAFVYLTDVDERSGPFQYIADSHRISRFVDDQRRFRLAFRQGGLQDEAQMMLDDEPARLRSVVGHAGTLFLVNTFVVHRGAPILEARSMRHAMTNYYYRRADCNEELVRHYSPLVDPEYVRGLRTGT